MGMPVELWMIIHKAKRLIQKDGINLDVINVNDQPGDTYVKIDVNQPGLRRVRVTLNEAIDDTGDEALYFIIDCNEVETLSTMPLSALTNGGLDDISDHIANRIRAYMRMLAN